MTTDQLTAWAVQHPWPAAGIAAAVLLAVLGTVWATVRTVRSWTWPPVPVRVAAAGALVCTAYTADTSWRFAAHHLGMRDTTERVIMFAAAEVALLACGLMARSNKAATATADHAGTPGVPGVLVWVITGVQIIPAYSESGIVGGTVRAVIGPVMAGLLWHLAMGLEIRVVRPDALSTGLPAMIGRELRERLLSYLGLATRDRSAEQITRDRATSRAVRLASRTKLRAFGKHRLAAAVARSGSALDPAQRDRLMQELAARRSATELSTITITSPWTAPTPPEVTLERVAEVGLPEAQQVALPAGVALPEQQQVALPAPPHTVPAGTRLLPVLCRRSVRRPAAVHAAAGSPTRTAVHAQVPLPETPEVALPDEVALPEAQQVALPDVPDEEEPEGDRDVPDPDPLIEQARLDFPGEVPGVGRLKAAYGVGQPRAQKIRDALKDKGQAA
ncbi:hypothetical protein PV356_35210 [Streptomyces sp. WI03-5b]|uniref:hypothetical protein n=1 Tax=Streptomyces sp. WI03-5b TaxID=462946 RepID=UPI0029BC2CA8|nr:hypothetical protein [Streptomyces sp. WI03-5b]MDX2624670.1 hypothetical protein [Streptomyces sp. WI03-5b]